MRLVLDTNVLVAGLRSNRGVAFQLLSQGREGGLRPILSVALMLEYEDVLLHQGWSLWHQRQLRSF